MERREFLKLSPAAAAATTTLTLTMPGGEPEPFDVRALRLQPGDVVVLTAPSYINQDTAERLKAYLDRALTPLGVKAMIMGDGLTVAGVLRTGVAGDGGHDLGRGKG